ncbi:MAG: DUF4124 domain-containing protein [Burkholderiales bacterium]
MRFPRVAVAVAALSLAAPLAQAGVFKCKGAAGKVIYSNEPCESVGAKKEKSLGKAELQSNQMRMRPRPANPEAAPGDMGSGSSFKGNAPAGGGGGDPRKSSGSPQT